MPLETLHSLPKPGDVVMLPAHGVGGTGEFLPGAYLVESIEHFYSHEEYEGLPAQRGAANQDGGAGDLAEPDAGGGDAGCAGAELSVADPSPLNSPG